MVEFQKIELIKELSSCVDDSSIARILNCTGVPTGSGKSWNKLRVSWIRKVYGIPPFSKAQNLNILNLEQVANKLEVSTKVVRRFIKAGLINAKQIVKYAPWMIEKSELKKPAVIKAVEAIRKTGKANLQINQQELQLL